MIGASMLWVGWFGFNAGSQLAADGGAAMALTVTHISAATASLTWALWERIKYGKSSMVGMVTGTIAGLASITPASGYVGPVEALIIGAVAGVLCQEACNVIKNLMNIDDTLCALMKRRKPLALIWPLMASVVTTSRPDIGRLAHKASLPVLQRHARPAASPR